MISVPTPRRRADDFQAALSRPATSSSTELDSLVALATQLRAEGASAPVPRPEFSASLRERLMSEADSVLVPITADDEAKLRLRTSPKAPRRQRRIAAVVAAAALIGGTSTVAYASQDALPGDSLYQVKRGLEGARNTITLSDSARGAVTLRHAQQRLAEVQGLVAREDARSAAAVAGALDDFADQADEAATLLLADAAETGRDRGPAELRAFVAESVAILDNVAPALGNGDREALGRAVSVLRGIDEAALELCPTCGTGGAVELPVALSSASDLFDSGYAGDLPELPTVTEALDLPPGSVNGGGATGSLEAPAPTPAPEAPEQQPSPAPEQGSGGSSGSSPAPSPSTPAAPAVPGVPEVVPPGGITELTDPVTGATGPLANPLRGVTETLDNLLGLNRR